MINKCFLAGNITRDPQLRSTQGGTQILEIGLAVNERRKNQQTGQWDDVPSFFDCLVFGNRAGALSAILSKGMKISVEGHLRWSSWEDKNTGQKRSKVEVIVDELELMSQRQQNGPQGAPQPGYAPQTQRGYQSANQPQMAPQMAPQQPQMAPQGYAAAPGVYQPAIPQQAPAYQPQVQQEIYVEDSDIPF